MIPCELVSGRVCLAHIYIQAHRRPNLHAFAFSKSNEYVVVLKKKSAWHVMPKLKSNAEPEREAKK